MAEAFTGNDKSRREFLRAAGLGLAGASLGIRPGLAADPAEIKVAAVITEFSYRSHAHVILENFVNPYLFNGEKTLSGMKVVALYVDQFPKDEMSRAFSKEYNIPIYPTIAGALCSGGETLAVDAVLSIGEHGKYPINEKGQQEYPRKRFFDEIVAVFDKSRKVAPIFNDKHLSYRWDWAKAMYDSARDRKIPFMAGSSVPLATRRPPLELEPGTELLDAVSIHGGGRESYDFHALEVLQSMVESRKGGVQGVSTVQFLEGDSLWDAAGVGVWNPKLADLAMAAELGPGKPTLRELVKSAPFTRQKLHGIVVTYKDGFRGTMLRVGTSATRWNFASMAVGDKEPRATSFYTGPWENRNLFKALSHAIQTFFKDKVAPYPVERTLLTTGVLDAAMESRVAKGKLIQTPYLEFAYKPTDYRAVREMGATWKIITPDIPQPKGIDKIPG